jgi:hypothetical protein
MKEECSSIKRVEATPGTARRSWGNARSPNLKTNVGDGARGDEK